MSYINPDVRKILLDVDNVLCEAERTQYEPFRDDIVRVAQKYLNVAASLLTAQKGVAAPLPNASPTPNDSRTPPPSPIAVVEEDATDAQTVSTSRSVTMYRMFLSEILPVLKATFRSESPQMAMRRAAALWQRNKNKGPMEKILKAANVEIRGVVPTPPVGHGRTVIVDDALPSSSRFRSLSEENSMPGLEDAE
jgi:hypothetical protein